MKWLYCLQTMGRVLLGYYFKHRCAATRVYLSAEATKEYPARTNSVAREKALRHGSEE